MDVLDALFANAGVGLCLLSSDGRVVRANAEWLDAAGFTEALVIGDDVRELFPEAPAALWRLYDQATKGVTVDLPRCGDPANEPGLAAWCGARLVPVALDGGAGVLVTFASPVQRKRHEAATEVVSELSAIVAASPVPIVALDVDGRALLWSLAAERLFGWTSAEVAGHSLPTVPVDKMAEFDAMLERTRERGSVRNLVTVRLDREGRRIPVSICTAPLFAGDGSYAGSVGVLTDLTEHRALEQALDEYEQRFAAVFDASPIAKVLIRTADRRIVEVNRAYLELSGVTREDILALEPPTPAAAQYPLAGEDHTRFWELVAKSEHIREFNHRFRSSDGKSGEAVASAQRLVLGGEEYVLVIVQDVTERRRAERALHESDERFRQLADTIQEVFWLTDLEKGSIIYVSPGYEQIWGRTCNSVYDDPRSWLDAIHVDDRERIRSAVLTKQVHGNYDEEYRIVRPDGTVRWVRDRGFPVKDAAGHVFRVAGSAQDITTRRELEAQLRQTQKMESIGLLAGGVAHDFNNLLTIILSNTEALKDTALEPGESGEILGEIHDAGERAASLTRQLLAFSRQEVIEARVVDLVAIVVDTEKMLRRILGEDVTLTLSLGTEPSRVKVDPGSFVQVLMNLAVNARDAMPRGGKLSIETCGVVLGDEFVQTHPHVAPGRYVRLSVTDTGTGMAAAVQARIFEPFFSTKAVGKGTGLGLSVVHGIVAQSGGHIEVESQLGRGTTFRIYVPAVDARPGSADVVASQASAVGTETILIVEDEEPLRRVAIRTLRDLGYSLLQASDGVEALAVLSEHPGTVDLLLTDVVMPRMDGRELAEAMQAMNPELRVLYTSGYTDDAVVRHGIKSAEVAFLAKPYDSRSLQRKVREVLDAGRRPSRRPRKAERSAPDVAHLDTAARRSDGAEF